MISKPHIAVLGTKETCLRVVEGLQQATLPFKLITLDDSNDTRSQLGSLQAHGAIVASEPDDAYDLAVSSSPSAVFVAGWYWLIKPQVLEKADIPFVGIHYSSLPSYRGSSPVVWQLINGEQEIGYSVFQLTRGMDEGPIFATGAVDRGDGYIGAVLQRLDSTAVPALITVAKQILTGEAVSTPQSDKNVSYAAPRVEQDGVIDWRKKAFELERFIRAQSKPYPGAFSTLDNFRVKVWRATGLQIPYYGAPGQVISYDSGAPVIACGYGTGLRLDEFDSPTDRIRGRFST